MSSTRYNQNNKQESSSFKDREKVNNDAQRQENPPTAATSRQDDANARGSNRRRRRQETKFTYTNNEYMGNHAGAKTETISSSCTEESVARKSRGRDKTSHFSAASASPSPDSNNKDTTNIPRSSFEREERQSRKSRKSRQTDRSPPPSTHQQETFRNSRNRRGADYDDDLSIGEISTGSATDEPGAHRISRYGPLEESLDNLASWRGYDEESQNENARQEPTTITLQAELAPNLDEQIEAALKEERQQAAAKIIKADVVEPPRMRKSRFFYLGCALLVVIGFCVTFVLVRNMGSPQERGGTDEEAQTSSPPPTFAPSIYPTTEYPTTSPTSHRFEAILKRISPVLNVTTSHDLSSDAHAAIDWLANGDDYMKTNLTHLDDNVDDLELVQRFALAVLYFSTGGSQWTEQAHWLSQQATCDWEHVECDDDNSVVRQILLQNNNLRGSIPTEIGLFTDLHIFQANDNKGLVGTLPTEIGNMSNVVFWLLGNNSLTGATIPTQVGSLSSTLRAFQVYSSKLAGSIPSEIGFLTNLEFLNIFDNNLEGTIPRSVEMLTSVGFLAFGNNTLTGNIPPEIGAMEQLTTLSLWGNGLDGTIPVEDMANLTNLASLDLSANLLTGSIGTEIGQLGLLTTLQLHTNKLDGSLPTEMFHLTSFTKLELSANRFSGSLPFEIGQLKNVAEMNLHTNSLTGTIPSEVGLLTSLTQLLLSQNELSGSVPTSELNALSNLWYLDLHGNNLVDGLETLFCDRPINSYILASDCYGSSAEVSCPCCNYCCEDALGSCEKV